MNRRRLLGQHFLHNVRVARAIVEALPAEPDRVVEIGAGRGALTLELLPRFRQVRALEVDASLAAGLARRLGRPPGLEVIRDDALSVDLEGLTDCEKWLLTGNLPYSVGTPILRRVMARPDLFPVAVVMVQLEVAERLVASPGASARGLLTVERELHADAEMLFTVSPASFMPRPAVVSAVVRLTLHAPPARPAVAARALRLASVAFQHRRKKLRNSLGLAGEDLDLAATLAAAGLSGDERAQEVSLQGWLSMACVGEVGLEAE